jgi:hypothetical protein
MERRKGDKSTLLSLEGNVTYPRFKKEKGEYPPLPYKRRKDKKIHPLRKERVPPPL